MNARRRVLLFALLTVFLMALCMVALGFIYADVNAEAADPECAHGCPWFRPVRLFFPVVMQCNGPFCHNFLDEPAR